MAKAKHKPQSALCLPGLNQRETLVLQLRARKANFRQIAAVTGIAPRKVWDLEAAALTKLIRYAETSAFLGVQ